MCNYHLRAQYLLRQARDIRNSKNSRNSAISEVRRLERESGLTLYA